MATAATAIIFLFECWYEAPAFLDEIEEDPLEVVLPWLLFEEELP